jgi:translocator protein
MTISGYLRLAACVVACLAAGFAGSFFTRASVSTWYRELRKPAFNPPDWLFGPVWTVLYIMMGVALFLVIREGFKTPGVRAAFAVFAVQLVLNITWSALFFGLKSPGAAFAEIVVLWAAIAATIALFKPISTAAAALLIPYILWVTFAAALNFAIWRLN